LVKEYKDKGIPIRTQKKLGTPDELIISTNHHVREFLSKQPLQKKPAGKKSG